MIAMRTYSDDSAREAHARHGQLRHCKRGGIYTFDLLFAVLVVVIMFYFAMLIAVEFRRELADTHDEFSGSTKAFLISEKIITRDAVFSDSGLLSRAHTSYQNVVDPSKIAAISPSDYIQRFRISGINISVSSQYFSSSVSEGNITGPNIYCYTRIVLVSKTALTPSAPGALRICMQDA